MTCSVHLQKWMFLKRLMAVPNMVKAVETLFSSSRASKSVPMCLFPKVLLLCLIDLHLTRLNLMD